MVIKKIIQIGNPFLNRKSKIVRNLNSKEVSKVIKNLVDSMRYHNLIGIAAPQIGEKLKIFVTEVRKTSYRNSKRDKLRIFINPKIVWFSKRQVIVYEGCGSVAYAKLFAPVKRPQKIIVEAFDMNNNKFRLKAEKLLSRVIQHEYDHLNGIEFTEKIVDMRKIMSSGEYRKMLKRRNRKNRGVHFKKNDKK